MEFKKYRLTPRVITDLKKRSAIGIYFYFIVLCIVLFSDGYYTRHPDFSNRFLLLITGICLFRILHHRVAGRVPQKFEKTNTRVFLFSIVLTGLIWGVGFALFMVQAGEVNVKLLMVMCSIGLCAGGGVAYIPELRLSMAFIFAMIVPAIVSMVVHHENMPLVISFVLFSSYLSFMALQGNREYWDALENEYLLVEKSKELMEMSRTDGLTGLCNRRWFDEMVAVEWSRSERNQTPISIILCDIDHFKRINDQYGHLAGDEYLKEVARLFKRVFKRKTDITVRYGGEEFVVLMPGESCENAVKLAETIRSMIQMCHLEYDGHSIRATISLGVSTHVPCPGEKQEILISKADIALYQSKTRGRNKVTKNN